MDIGNASIIVKNGILKVGDYVVCGLASGRVRAMMDYLGNNVKEADLRIQNLLLFCFIFIF